MKISYILLPIVLFSVFCTSCSLSFDKNTEAENLVTAEFDSEPSENELELPYFVDLEIGEVVSNVQNVKPWENWGIVPENGENVLVRKEVIDKAATVPAGSTPIPGLNIGDRGWEGYSATFDFSMGEFGFITFVMYNESNIMTIDDDYLEGEQRFWFRLYSDGRILFETSLIGSHFLTDDDGKEILFENFDLDAWNTMTLKNEDNKLIIILNDVEDVKVYEFHGNEYGRLAIGGSNGVMFKNIRIE